MASGSTCAPICCRRRHWTSDESLQQPTTAANERRGEARMRISLILALALLASELVPAWLTREDRRDNDLGISTTFAMALVITGPIGFAVGLRVVLSLVTGLRDGLPARRMFAEAARWASAMALGRILYATATHQTILG